MREGVAQVIEQQYERADGTAGVLQTLKSPFRNEAGELVGIITHNRDVTESRMLQQNYMTTQERLALALENMADAIVSFGPDRRTQFCNSNFPRLFPLSAKARSPDVHYRDMIELSFKLSERKLSEGDSVESFVTGFEGMLREPGVLQLELSDGRWIEAESRPQPDGSCLMTYHDISASKKAEAELRELNEKLSALATTDSLTGLKNRRAFDLALQQAADDSEPKTALLADIDHFKAYNDRYGHPASDEVIRAVASCLDREVSRVGGFAARYGGEELAAILRLCDVDSAFDVAVAFRNSVEALEIIHEGSSYGIVSVSIGISTLPGQAPVSVGDFLRAADQALYASKAAGRNKVTAA